MPEGLFDDVKEVDGKITWTHRPGDRYRATGICPNGKRCKPVESDNWSHVACINLFRGTKWLIRNGQKKVIQTVWN